RVYSRVSPNLGQARLEADHSPEAAPLGSAGRSAPPSAQSAPTRPRQKSAPNHRATASCPAGAFFSPNPAARCRLRVARSVFRYDRDRVPRGLTWLGRAPGQWEAFLAGKWREPAVGLIPRP